ncbi:MAG: site-specific DNA-methyltransferase [Clostridia bacterium]|nr:site-specific DNA-methyltransferase [Clostridia bacterium]
MKIISKEINEIIPYENNAKLHPKEQIEQIKNSILEFGNNDPIAIDENNVIIEGHGRYEALKELGFDKISVIVLDELSEEQKNAYRIVHNQLTMNTDWDIEKLKEELNNIKDIDMSNFDLDIAIEDIIDDEEINNFDVEKAIEDINNEPITKRGDIYQLGNHVLMCGDSTSKEDVKKLVGDEVIKTIFSSPPYNMNKKMYNSYEDNLASEEYIKFNLDVINVYKQYLKGYLFWNISYNKNARWEFIEIMHRIIKNTGLLFLELIVWNKKKAMPIKGEMLRRQYEDILLVADEETINDEIDLYVCTKNDSKAVFNKRVQQKLSNYWELTVDSNTQLENHKACFPVELPKRAINLTTLENEIICDPFGGSGTTLIACELLKRKCFMMELDPVYCDVIIKRWEELTGKKAVLLNE